MRSTTAHLLFDHDPLVRKQAQFSMLLQRHRGAIFHVINRYDFIESKFDKQEYFQEIAAHAWEKFNLWDPEKGDFGAWLMGMAKFRLMHFRRDHFRRHFKVTSTDDIIKLEGLVVDEALADLSEDEISLQFAIAALPNKQREIIKLWLDGENLPKRSIADGRSLGYYSNLLTAAIENMRKNSHRHFPGRKHKEKLGLRQGVGKPINQLSTTGEFIRTWSSGAEAVRAGFSRKSIQVSLRGEANQSGYLWQYADDCG